MLRRAFVNGFPHILIGTDDITQLVSQIVLATHTLSCAVNRDTGSDRWWRHEQVADDHPLGSREFSVETKNPDVFITYGLHDRDAFFGFDRAFFGFCGAFLLIVFRGFVCGHQSQPILSNLWLLISTAAVADCGVLLLSSFASLLSLVVIRVRVAHHLGLAKLVNSIKSSLWVSVFESFLVCRVALVHLDFAALVADSLEDFLNLSNETYAKLAMVSE